jgi:hypothetical protein
MSRADHPGLETRRQLTLGKKVSVCVGLATGRTAIVRAKLTPPHLDEAITGWCNYNVLLEDDLGHFTVSADYRRCELREVRRNSR